MGQKRPLWIVFTAAVGLFLGIAIWWSASHAGRAHADRLSFNQTIQPILSENCYACHGPDPGARKAGLRLDRSEFAFAAHEKFGPAIVRGNPDKSPLVRRIESEDPKERMQPPEALHTLNPEQITLLRRWVKEGAVYEEHWSSSRRSFQRFRRQRTRRGREIRSIDSFSTASKEKV